MGKTLSEIKDALPADRREKIEQRYDAVVDELREIVAENERLRMEWAAAASAGYAGTLQKRLAEAERLLRRSFEIATLEKYHALAEDIDAFLADRETE